MIQLGYLGFDVLQQVNGDLLELPDVVLAQILTPVIPTVVASGYDQLYDVTQVGFGVA